MILQTKHFGPIEMDEKDILTFKDGLPGFEKLCKYILINSSDEKSPFKWLQSIDEQQLAFAVINPFSIKKDYLFDISDETVKSLGIEMSEDVVTLAILVIPDELEKISMNLKAPVIINSKNKKSAQIILDTDKYTVRHYILDELRRQEGVGDACIDAKEGSDDCNK